MTRTYKRKLDKTQRQQFRSRMWEFRRRPEDLTAEQSEALEALFQEIPTLRSIYELRWKLTRVFDSGVDRATAAVAIASWKQEAEGSGLDWGRFLGMYERHRDGILAYFAEHRSSGPVEGLNNKVRVLLKRSYGLKSVQTLWTRLILDVNWVGERLGKSVTYMKILSNRIWTVFCGYYT
ncbi:MAG: ISL3 family transposase [Leifsonia sp.]